MLRMFMFNYLETASPDTIAGAHAISNVETRKQTDLSFFISNSRLRMPGDYELAKRISLRTDLFSGDSGLSWARHGAANNWQSVASSADGSKLIAAVCSWHYPAWAVAHRTKVNQLSAHNCSTQSRSTWWRCLLQETSDCESRKERC